MLPTPESLRRLCITRGGNSMYLKVVVGLALAAMIAVSGVSFADNYPSRALRIIVPFSAGSATDILARVISDKLADRLGQPVIVENRPGSPGTTAVAKSRADGYTLMLTSNGHTIAGVVNKDLPYDPVRDFA